MGTLSRLWDRKLTITLVAIILLLTLVVVPRLVNEQSRRIEQERAKYRAFLDRLHEENSRLVDEIRGVTADTNCRVKHIESLIVGTPDRVPHGQRPRARLDQEEH
jgi:hypothetical protein